MPNDGWRYELVRGELRRYPYAGMEHGQVAANVIGALGAYIHERKLGSGFAASGFVLARNPDTVRVPDVAFVAKERADTPTPDDYFWPGAPDLAVEIVEPEDKYVEVEEKVVDWLSAGTRMVMIINPRTRRVTVHQAGNGVQLYTENDVLDAGDVAPGWTMPVREIFA
jgi:Uma2 family endonuclease